MSTPYFVVEKVDLANGVAFVDGRLGDFDLRKGHVFSRCFETVDAWRNQKQDFRDAMLHLTGIEAYRHQCEVLSGGMTARLKIEGADLELLNRAKVIE